MNYRVWITPDRYKDIEAPCPSAAIEQILKEENTMRIWKISKL